MTRDEMLTSIEQFLDIPVAALNAYANEDTLGGFDFDPSVSKWPGGSLWDGEGRTLYSLVRALKPTTVLELGTHRGCSTSHLAAAILRNDLTRDTSARKEEGKVIAVDIWEGAGDLIPDELRSAVFQRFGDAVDIINTLPDNSVNFVFEDLLHGAEQVAAVIEALKPKLTSRAVVVHHDSEHGDDGVKIRHGIELAGVTAYRSLLAQPSDCGLAVWRAATKAPVPMTELLLSPETVAKLKASDLFKEEPPPTKKPAVKRAPAKKTTARKAPAKKTTARKAPAKK